MKEESMPNLTDRQKAATFLDNPEQDITVPNVYMSILLNEKLFQHIELFPNSKNVILTLNNPLAAVQCFWGIGQNTLEENIIDALAALYNRMQQFSLTKENLLEMMKLHDWAVSDKDLKFK